MSMFSSVGDGLGGPVVGISARYFFMPTVFLNTFSLLKRAQIRAQMPDLVALVVDCLKKKPCFCGPKVSWLQR